MRKHLLLILFISALTFAKDNANETSIMNLMLTQVVPASDVIWSAEDPQTDADWQVFDDAADKLIAAFELSRQGGSGVNDAEWASDDKWKAYVDAEMAALDFAKLAIAARDIEKLWEANDALYTPCENCHVDFNPGVTGQ